MKQSIVAIIRPNLNLAQKESEAAHLIEHILVSPDRLLALRINDEFYAKNIIFHNGSVNNSYLSEYYVVKTEVADEVAKILKEHQNELYISPTDFEKIKSALLEEIIADRGEFIDLGEQLIKASYKSDSPCTRNIWNDLESVKNLTYEETVKIFKKYNNDSTIFSLSFDDYKIERLPVVEKNQWKENVDTILLTHPWQSPGSIDTHITTFMPEKLDVLVSTLYRRALTDYRFGLLYNQLRNKNGLVYDVSMSADYDDNTLDIYFFSDESGREKALDIIKKSLGDFDFFIKENLEYIKARLKFEIELDWGDIQNNVFNVIDQVVSGQFKQSPVDLLKKLESVTAEELQQFNQLYLNQFNNNTVLTKRVHGKKVETKIVYKGIEL